MGLSYSDGSASTFAPKGKGPVRLENIYNHVASQIADGKPLLIAVEGYSYGSAFNSHQLGEAGGIIRLALHWSECPFFEVPPQWVKKFVTGKSQSKKDEMRLGVFKRWGREFKTEHEVDAFALSKIAEAAYLTLHNLSPGDLVSAQIEVIAKCLPNCRMTAPLPQALQTAQG